MSPWLNRLAVLAELPVMYNDATLQTMVLWAFVFGMALVWMVMHFHRSALIRKKKRDCQELNDRLQDILDHSRDAVYSFDLEQRRFNYLSPACLSLTGYNAGEIEEKGLEELLEYVHPEDKEKVLRLVRMLPDQVKEHEWLGLMDFRFFHRDGQYRPLSNHLHVNYNSAGDAVSVSGSVRDVSEIASLEEVGRILERRFQDSQKMAGLGLLASGIAHDFNNLMTVVLGNAELALLECGGSDGGWLDEIKKTTLRAAELATQLLVYTGKTAVVVDSIDLSSVVRDMGSMLDVSISKKVTIEYCLEDDLPVILGDVSQIRQVALNLITNASESIGDRPGVIAISIHEVHLRPGDLDNVFPPGQVLEGSYVQMEVSDTGEGMSADTLQKMFDPMFTTKITGRGLGLASLLNAVQRHNGAIQVKSEEGRGTVFRVYFPAEEQNVDAATQEALAEAGDWRGYGTVLIADDEEAILNVATYLMERLGFRVITAANGFETVDLYTEHAAEISVLLMDLNMPRLNGLEATWRIRHLNPTLPVLFMSGYPREQVMDRFGRQPHTDFIKKPFKSASLAIALRNVMERRAQQDTMPEHEME